MNEPGSERRGSADANGKPASSAGFAENMREGQRAEDESLHSKSLLRTVLDIVPAFICAKDVEGRFLLVNQRLADFYGTTVEELTGKLHADVCEDEEELRAMLEADRRVIEGGEPVLIAEEPMKNPDGSITVLDTYKIPFSTPEKPAVLIASIDVTERKKAVEAHDELEVQLRQAQKMEAVGQLAGGVAHDFNNLLQVILGFGDMARAELGAESPIRKDLDEIMKAGNRAKTLVRQLLAFSRRQVLDMRDINLNDLIADLMTMLRRVIGEHITLDVISGHDLGIVSADPGQIQQILMNLCVNARDAMPDGGRITIETENVHVDEAFCDTHAWAQPGPYALLSVSDTGCGMDEETMANVFEPFFTTKGVGEGTGLGLSTVYGLVKQHQGMIHAHSEVDWGTTFKVYLPLVERPAAPVADRLEGPALGGTETILLAEDDEMVRTLSQTVLERAGYTVLTACDGEDALRVFDERVDDIDMALLDVMMPKLGGRAVFEHIQKARPNMRVLFASGYSMSAIHTDFVLDEGLELVQKPCPPDDLLRRVRQLLDGGQEEGA